MGKKELRFSSQAGETTMEKYIEDVGTTGFEDALKELKSGWAISRVGWNGKHQFIYKVSAYDLDYRNDIEHGFYKKTDFEVKQQDFIAFKTVDDTVVPWVASQTDLLADDWFVYPIG